jgi:sigma-B regulation protein RsbU (phosphoserine phosphatase)
MEEASYDESPIRLEKGDTLILTSDGTTDAVSPAGEMFDSDRFLQSIRAHCSEELGQFINGLYQEIAAFTGNAELSDDVTILAIRRGN